MYRALGFSIYYALVNLGGAIGPILASEIRADFGMRVGVRDVGRHLRADAARHGALLPRARRGRGARRRSGPSRKVFGDMLLVFRNVRFISFLVVFSGYWIMFWQVFYSLPFYIDEVLHFKRFEILETVDAWTIILLSVPLTALAKKMRAMNAMILGFVISSAVLADHGLVADGGRGDGRAVLLRDRRVDTGAAVLRIRGPAGAARPGGHVHGLRVPADRHRIVHCRPARARGWCSITCATRTGPRRCGYSWRGSASSARRCCSSTTGSWARREKPRSLAAVWRHVTLEGRRVPPSLEFPGRLMVGQRPLEP